jgi:hypothetical protein
MSNEALFFRRKKSKMVKTKDTIKSQAKNPSKGNYLVVAGVG